MSTRSQRKSKKTASPSPKKAPPRIENSWVLLLRDTLFDNDNFSIISLPHPANGNIAKFCLDEKNNKMFEVVTFNEPYRSWFIGETVKSDGSVLLVTPMNPLFLVLPRLKDQCCNRAMPLEDLLSEKGYSKILPYLSNLDDIGDLKGSPELKAYKYNEAKTLAWLEGKVRKLAKVLRQKKIHVTSGVASATFIASNIGNEEIDEEFFLKYAFGIIAEYLQNELAELLENKFDFKSDLIETIGKKRKSDAESIAPTKKIKSESSENESLQNILNSSINSINESKKPKLLTAKEKARQKAASGSKTISAFFSKK